MLTRGGGGPKSQKFSWRHLWMAPSVHHEFNMSNDFWISLITCCSLECFCMTFGQNVGHIYTWPPFFMYKIQILQHPCKDPAGIHAGWLYATWDGAIWHVHVLRVIGRVVVGAATWHAAHITEWQIWLEKIFCKLLGWRVAIAQLSVEPSENCWHNLFSNFIGCRSVCKYRGKPEGKSESPCMTEADISMWWKVMFMPPLCGVR